MAYRELSGEEIKQMIENHEAWLKDVYGNNGKSGREAYVKERTFDFSKLSEELANDPRRADFSNVKFTDESVKGDSYRTQFSCADLSGANFKGADFSEVKGDIFNYTHLSYTDFSDAKMVFNKDKDSWNHSVFGCDFRHANLKGVSEDMVNDMRSNCDLDSAVTDKGVIKSILVPYGSSNSMPNDYWRANFYGVPGYANCSYNEYTNIPFDPMIITENNKNSLKEAGYQFDKEQKFLKFNEGQQISLWAGKESKLVDAFEFSKVCCDAYLGKEKVEPKTVTNDTQVWFIKFNPTSRAPKNAIEFVSATAERKYDSLIMKNTDFRDCTQEMLGDNVNIELNTDMVNRCERIILSDCRQMCSSIPEPLDSYPTYIFGKDDMAARGEVLVCPFIMPSYKDKSVFEIGDPYNIRTMENLVEDLMEEQNGRRIEYYKELSLANGIVPKDINDEDLTKLAKENMLLIQRPWQLDALTGDYNDNARDDIDKLSNHIDCMNDKETLALQNDVKKLGFLYYDTTDIAKQMEFLAIDIRKNKNVPLDKPIPSIGNKDIDKIMGLYNKVVSHRAIHIENGSKERKEKQEKRVEKQADTKNQKNANLHLICPESCIKLGKENIGIVLDFKNKVIAWTKRIDGKDSNVKEMVSVPKEKAIATINEKNEQLVAKGFKPVDVNKMRTVVLPRDADWGITVNGKHVNIYRSIDNQVIDDADKCVAKFRLSTQAILAASTYGRHLKDGKWVLNERRTLPVLTDRKDNVVSLYKALSDLSLIKTNKKNIGKDSGKDSR